MIAPRSVLKLSERVRDGVWKAITAEIRRTLIESLPRRVEAMIKSRGGQTKYYAPCIKKPKLGQKFGHQGAQEERLTRNTTFGVHREWNFFYLSLQNSS